MQTAEKANQPPSQATERGKKLAQRWQSMQSVMQPWKSQWQEIADYMMPRKAGISSKTHSPNSDKEALLFDTTAGSAAMTMAGGLLTWTTPANEPWFQYEPIFGLRNSEPVKSWLQEGTQRIQELLANSNFYSCQHEDLLNHCVFGTSALYVAFENGKLVFESLPVGSFAIEENAYGEVDTLFREMELTARQAKEMFGEENLPKKVCDCLKDEAKLNSKFTFIHAVYPRPEEDRPKDRVSRQAGWGKPFASCYFEASEKHLVKEGGYNSFPYSVGRYLEWAALGGKAPYGNSPGWEALPDTRQVNFLQMMLDCAAEKMVRPAMIAPEEMEGELILSAGGITYMASSISQERWPRPIQQVGDYNVAQERIKMRQDSIKAKFHVELFNMFAGLDRQMTATEVAERAAEKITLISPAFSRLISEKITPLLQRVFSLAMENELLPYPPDEAIAGVNGLMGYIEDPAVTYQSRLALAIQAIRAIGLDNQLQRSLSLSQVDPNIMDNYDLDQITRDTGRANGMKETWFRKPEVIAQIRNDKAQAQQAAQAAMLAEQGSKAVKNIGGIEEAAKLLQ